jgi:hypothetical protein
VLSFTFFTGHEGPYGEQMYSSTLFLDRGTRRGGGQRHALAAFYPGKDPVPTVQEAGWDPGPVWTCAENLAPTRIRSPDRPDSNQSLYRLSYPAYRLCCQGKIIGHTQLSPLGQSSVKLRS